MKILAFFILLAISSLSYGQAVYNSENLPPIDAKTKKVVFKAQHKNTSTKDQNFLKCKDWAMGAFNSYKNAVQGEDKDLGKLVFRSLVDVYGLSNAMHFRLTTIAQDSVASIIIDDMSVPSPVYTITPEILYESFNSAKNDSEELQRKIHSNTASRSDKSLLKKRQHVAETEAATLSYINKVFTSLTQSFISSISN